MEHGPGFQLQLSLLMMAIAVAGLLIGLSLAALNGNSNVFIESFRTKCHKLNPKSKTPRADKAINEALTGVQSRFYAVIGIAFATIHIVLAGVRIDWLVYDACKGLDSPGVFFYEFSWVLMLIFIVYLWPVARSTTDKNGDKCRSHIEYSARGGSDGTS